jgi:UDP-2,3-diacylglucosamine pyrophosphatase LpxH
LRRITNKIHTIVVSDLHLSDEEPVDPNRPLWKKFRRKEFFIDKSFHDFLRFMETETKEEPIELILNGDIFDFDSVMSLPENASYHIKAYEKRLGLNAMEEKSVFKIETILLHHDVWTKALSDFIKKGHQVVFIIGNHDIELNWVSVQEMVIKKLQLPPEFINNVRFCEWFYISEGDTLIEHGHQYDPYCMALNPINPVIKKNGKFKIRLPFGNLANRFMINNMGLKNPHCDSSFVKSTWEFVVYFFEYEIKTQPFMGLTWFFGAMRTLIYSIGEGFLPALKDPLTFDDRLKNIARKSNSTPQMVLTLKENHAHPAVMRPLMILRELWLDRAFLIFAILVGSWQIFTTSIIFADISLWWFIIPLSIATPFFLFYAHGISSSVHVNQELALEHSPLSAQACQVGRIIMGHTHNERHRKLKGTEYLNTGTWSPIFKDLECTEMYGNKLFVWIDPNQERKASLFSWDEGSISLTEHSIKYFKEYGSDNKNQELSLRKSLYDQQNFSK